MIDKAVNDRLKEQYCPEGSNLRRAQLRMLDMLVYLDQVCRANNIVYWLDSGTLLGAVRHGGFIPWDDDVDVCIDRRDENKLKRAIKQNPHPDFVIQDRRTDKSHWREWFCLRDLKTEYIQDSVFHNNQKFRGLQVDVFLMERNVNHRLWRISAKLYNLKLLLAEKQLFTLATILHYFDECIVFPMLRLLAKLVDSGHEEDYHKVYGQVFDHYFPVNKVLPVKEMIFEGHRLSVPKDSVSYLSESFGKDFMSLPSKEVLDKFNHHVEILFKD